MSSGDVGTAGGGTEAAVEGSGTPAKPVAIERESPESVMGALADRAPPTILVIDNYDSFAYNLVQYVGEVVLAMGGETEHVVVRRNDAIDVAGIRHLDPDGIVISPGPGTPEEAGVSMPIFADLSIPTLGVCLGHQALCAANGATVGHADAVVHGKSSAITHDGRGVFEGLPQGIAAGRYHSLAVRREHLPDILEETARTDDEAGVVMGVRHRHEPHVGVQFHPESILTDRGLTMVANFVRTYVDGETTSGSRNR